MGHDTVTGAVALGGGVCWQRIVLFAPTPTVACTVWPNADIVVMQRQIANNPSFLFIGFLLFSLHGRKDRFSAKVLLPGVGAEGPVQSIQITLLTRTLILSTKPKRPLQLPHSRHGHGIVK